MSALRFPIRVKILVTLLLVVTAVVGVITFTMANLFHQDKRAYVTNLASMLATGAAEESRAILVGYADRLRGCARITADLQLDAQDEARLLSAFFEDFPELVAISIDTGGPTPIVGYDPAVLESTGWTTEKAREQLLQAVALDSAPEAVHVRNATTAHALPVMAMVVAQVSRDGSARRVSALIRLDALIRLAGRTRNCEVFLADSSGLLLAHSDPARVARRERVELQVDPEQVSGQYNSSLTREYVADGREMIGGFAGVTFGDLIAGATIPESAAYLAARDLLGSLITTALVLLVAAAFAGLFWAHRLTRPVERLSEAAREIGSGRFDVKIAPESRDEIGALAVSFNQMAQGLLDHENALHEAQAQLVQSAKMAAFGQLGAGIAHEVKNPLAGILGCAQLSLRKVEPGTPLEKNLQLIEKETRRCKSIIENLLSFARQERAVMSPIDINPVVRDAVAICGHQLTMEQIQVREELADNLPQVHGNANQLQQVVLNLIMNAQQAMEGRPGAVTVSTHVEQGEVQIVVADDGPGIPPEVVTKLFEPFFTTKPGGKGTGLGLSVSFGIIKDHGGEVMVDGGAGHGATFTISLPRLEGWEPQARVSAS